MWRAFFLAFGIFCVVLGLECLGVDRVMLRVHDDPPLSVWPFDSIQPQQGPNKQLVPAPWAPWSLISSGAVVCLYSFTIPRRVSGA
jgi:hypothetical protein